MQTRRSCFRSPLVLSVVVLLMSAGGPASAAEQKALNAEGLKSKFKTVYRAYQIVRGRMAFRELRTQHDRVDVVYRDNLKIFGEKKIQLQELGEGMGKRVARVAVQGKEKALNITKNLVRNVTAAGSVLFTGEGILSLFRDTKEQVQTAAGEVATMAKVELLDTANQVAGKVLSSDAAGAASELSAQATDTATDLIGLVHTPGGKIGAGLLVGAGVGKLILNRTRAAARDTLINVMVNNRQIEIAKEVFGMFNKGDLHGIEKALLEANTPVPAELHKLASGTMNDFEHAAHQVMEMIADGKVPGEKTRHLAGKILGMATIDKIEEHIQGGKLERVAELLNDLRAER